MIKHFPEPNVHRLSWLVLICFLPKSKKPSKVSFDKVEQDEMI